MMLVGVWLFVWTVSLNMQKTAKTTTTNQPQNNNDNFRNRIGLMQATNNMFMTPPSPPRLPSLTPPSLPPPALDPSPVSSNKREHAFSSRSPPRRRRQARSVLGRGETPNGFAVPLKGMRHELPPTLASQVDRRLGSMQLFLVSRTHRIAASYPTMPPNPCQSNETRQGGPKEGHCIDTYGWSGGVSVTWPQKVHCSVVCNGCIVQYCIGGQCGGGHILPLPFLLPLLLPLPQCPWPFWWPLIAGGG